MTDRSMEGFSLQTKPKKKISGISALMQEAMDIYVDEEEEQEQEVYTEEDEGDEDYRFMLMEALLL